MYRTDAFYRAYIEELNQGDSRASWVRITRQRAATVKALFDAEVDLAGDEDGDVVDRQRARNQEIAALLDLKFGDDMTPWWTPWSDLPMVTVEERFEKLAEAPSEDGKNLQRVWITFHPEVSHEDFRRAFNDLPLKRRIFSAGALHIRPDLAKTLLGHRSRKIRHAAQKSMDFAADLAQREAERNIRRAALR